MSHDSRIAKDPGKHFSATGSARKLEIWILFSDRDPNPRPNVDNCFGKELSHRTSSDIKLGTGGTGKIPEFDFIFGGT